MIKRIIGALYGIFLEEPLDRLHKLAKEIWKRISELLPDGVQELLQVEWLLQEPGKRNTLQKNSAGSINDMSKYHTDI